MNGTATQDGYGTGRLLRVFEGGTVKVYLGKGDLHVEVLHPGSHLAIESVINKWLEQHSDIVVQLITIIKGDIYNSQGIDYQAYIVTILYREEEGE